jgi:hypothetical protein
MCARRIEMAANPPNDLVPVTLKIICPYSAVYRTTAVERSSVSEVTVYVPQDQVRIMKDGAKRVTERREDHVRVYHNVKITAVVE